MGSHLFKFLYAFPGPSFNFSVHFQGYSPTPLNISISTDQIHATLTQVKDERYSYHCTVVTRHPILWAVRLYWRNYHGVVIFVPPTLVPPDSCPLDMCPPGHVSPWTSVPPGQVFPKDNCPPGQLFPRTTVPPGQLSP